MKNFNKRMALLEREDLERMSIEMKKAEELASNAGKDKHFFKVPKLNFMNRRGSISRKVTRE